MTRGEEMIGSLNAALVALDRLRLEHYQDSDVRAIVEGIGSKTERFFKAAIWPGASSTDTFDGLINRLKSLGVSKSTRDAIHELRDLYNIAKHDPNHSMRLKPATDVVTAARVGIQLLAHLIHPSQV